MLVAREQLLLSVGMMLVTHKYLSQATWSGCSQHSTLYPGCLLSASLIRLLAVHKAILLLSNVPDGSTVVVAVPCTTPRFSALQAVAICSDPRMGNPSAQPGEEEGVARRLGKAGGS